MLCGNYSFYNLTLLFFASELSSSSLLKLTQTEMLGEVPHFTKKELAVMDLICQQYSSKEIASIMDCSIRAVESARERIQNKVGARNMVGIVLYAIKHAFFGFK